MPFKEISKNIFDCSICEHRCDSISKAIYNFDDDINFSNIIQDLIISLINRTNKTIEATKYDKNHDYPDIIVKTKNDKKDFSFIEIKVQTRTFMKIHEILKEAKLYPSETLALNLSDLERYFLIKENTKIPIYIVWCLMNRACITGLNFENLKFYFQEIDLLKEIRRRDINNSRMFRRKSGEGDVNEKGEHKGVVVNYHFSINELKSGLPVFI